MARPWAALSWKAYLPSLYAGQQPVDFDEYRYTAVVANLRRPGYARAFSQTTELDHVLWPPAWAMSAAPMVIMGDRDPDFKDPAAEARWIGDTLYPSSGHGPRRRALPPVPAA